MQAFPIDLTFTCSLAGWPPRALPYASINISQILAAEPPSYPPITRRVHPWYRDIVLQASMEVHHLNGFLTQSGTVRLSVMSCASLDEWSLLAFYLATISFKSSRLFSNLFGTGWVVSRRALPFSGSLSSIPLSSLGITVFLNLSCRCQFRSMRRTVSSAEY